MPRPSWRDRANKAIWEAKSEGERQGLTGKTLEKFVSQNGYPFGERAMHPYKIWLSAFGIIMQHRPTVVPRSHKPAKNQMTLF